MYSTRKHEMGRLILEHVFDYEWRRIKLTPSMVYSYHFQSPFVKELLPPGYTGYLGSYTGQHGEIQDGDLLLPERVQHHYHFDNYGAAYRLQDHVLQKPLAIADAYIFELEQLSGATGALRVQQIRYMMLADPVTKSQAALIACGCDRGYVNELVTDVRLEMLRTQG